MKVASLLPAATEMLCAMGAEETLVGISHECDYPARVSSLLRLTRARTGVAGPSKDIHRSITGLIEDALSIYEVDAGLLKTIGPDVIITQDLCDVCAVSYKDVCAAIESMTAGRARIVRLHPERLEDVYGDIRRIGSAVGCAAGAARLVEALKARMTRLAESARSLPCKDVLMVEWLQPVMIGGLWTADLARAAGAHALASSDGAHARTLGVDELAALDPDVVVVKPCGFNLERTIEETARFGEYFPWSKWRAVEQAQVYIVDGNAYFNRPGPRIVDSAEILAACVHGEEFPELRRQYTRGVKRVRRDLSLGELDE